MPRSVESDIRSPHWENLPSSIYPWPVLVKQIDHRMGCPEVLHALITDYIEPHLTNSTGNQRETMEWRDPFGVWKPIGSEPLDALVGNFLKKAYDNAHRRHLYGIERLDISLYPKAVLGPIHFRKAVAVNIGIGYNLGDGSAFLNNETGLWEFTQKKATYSYIARLFMRE